MPTVAASHEICSLMSANLDTFIGSSSTQPVAAYTNLGLCPSWWGSMNLQRSGGQFVGWDVNVLGRTSATAIVAPTMIEDSAGLGTRHHGRPIRSGSLTHSAVELCKHSRSAGSVTASIGLEVTAYVRFWRTCHDQSTLRGTRRSMQ